MTVLVTSQHLGALRTITRGGYCIPGTRAFFARHGMDWRGFLRHGLAAEAFEATGDAMAIKLAAYAREQAAAGVTGGR